ncbi:hypothetical protein Kpho01_68900 [Kitasatospora phosalacinea]|uniref:Uncharacterized protein n=1 Tax=Kitasatospora phosalacinea TaxID=2065 RepID=A0A9W6PM96_9ACTN|nr:hypothetical protein Kpho01_68900 [Kitasatospora phosalacinea]
MGVTQRIYPRAHHAERHSESLSRPLRPTASAEQLSLTLSGIFVAIQVELALSWVLRAVDRWVCPIRAIRAGGGFTAQEQQRRERGQLDAAERFERGDGNGMTAP